MLIGAMNHPGRNLAEEIRWIGEARFDFVDLTLEPPCAAAGQHQPAAVRRMLDEHGLRGVGHTAYYLPIGHPYLAVARASVDQLREAVDFFAEAGITLVNVHPDGHAPHHDRGFIAGRNAEMLQQLIAHAGKAGVTIMVENVPGSFNTVEQLNELFKPLPELAFHLDIGHANIHAPAGNPARLIETFVTRLRHVHFHDNKNNADLHLPLGSGTVPWRRLAGMLKEFGYDATITLEVFTEDKSYLVQSRDKLRRFWDEK